MPPLPAPTRVTFERGRVATVVQADAGESARRRIAGTLVPYGVEGRASDGFLYVFEAGSVTPGRDRSPLLMGHDRNQPVGVLAEFSSGDDGASGSFAIDATGAGDEALVQASSGSRGGFSVGAELILYSFDESGDELVIRVQQAELLETSLVSVGAYATAAVASVAATHPQGGTVPPTPTAPNGAAASPVVPAGDAAAAQTPPAPTGVALAASPAELHAGHPAIVIAEPGRPTLTATQYVGAMVRAMNGDRSARQLIEAALGVSHLADNPGVLPPSYTTEILGEVDQPRPLRGLARTPPLPASGMVINKPVWTTKPNGGWMADDTVPPATNTPKIGLQPSAIRQWAYAFSCSVAVMERSSPDWVEAVYRQSVADFWADVEAAIAALLPDATGAAATIGAGIAEVWTNTKRVANVLLMAPDAFGDLFDAAGPPPRWVGGSLNAGMNGSIGGLEPVISGDLDAGAIYVGARNTFEQRESTPIRLSANNIGAMNVEIGVTAFASFDVEVPGAWVRVLSAAPAA